MILRYLIENLKNEICKPALKSQLSDLANLYVGKNKPS